MQAARIRALAHDAKQTIISEGRVSDQALADEFMRSKFCFAIRAGGPGTRKFYDAVSALCIPVVVSDEWFFVQATFTSFIDYSAFTIIIPEARWMSDLSGVVSELESMSATRLKQMFEALRNVRPLLLYLDRGSYALGSVLLSEVVQRRDSGSCNEGFSTQDMYPLESKVAARKPKEPLNGTELSLELIEQAKKQYAAHLNVPSWYRF